MRAQLWPVVLLAVGCSGGSGEVTDEVDGVDTDVEVSDTDTVVLPPGECATVRSVTVEDGSMMLQKRLTVSLNSQAPVWVACAADSDPAEIILAESTVAAAEHTIDIVGLWDSETWTCEVAATCEGAEVEISTFETLGLPADVPRFDLSSSGTPPQGVWTLLNTEKPCVGSDSQEVMIVDLRGRVRWLYDVGVGYELDIDAWWTGDHVHLGGGWGLFDESDSQRGTMRQIDLVGNERFRRDLPSFGLGYNHHSEPLADGQILSLTTSRNTEGNNDWYGVAVELWDPVSDEVTWTWDSQHLVDQGVLGYENDNSPWHANALEWTTDALGDAMWVSTYVGQQVWRIDRATGDRTHVLGPGGDFTLLDTSGSPLPANEWTSAQHDPDFLPDGRVLLYDNGVDYNSSRIVELQLDLQARTATKLWEWTEPGWYTPIVGDADYLEGGHVLVAKGVVSCLTFWLPNEDSAVIEIDPATDEQVWRLDFADHSEGVFRAQRYDGCEIFSNAKHCPAVATRLAELRAL